MKSKCYLLIFFLLAMLSIFISNNITAQIHPYDGCYEHEDCMLRPVNIADLAMDTNALNIKTEYYKVIGEAKMEDTMQTYDMSLQYSLEQNFDARGLLVEDQKTEGRKVITRKFIYKDDKEILKVIYEENGKRRDSIQMNYDRKGLLRDYTRYNHRNIPTLTVTFTYSRGNIINIRRKDESNASIAMYRYIYDRNTNEMLGIEALNEDFRVMESIKHNETYSEDIGAKGISVAHFDDDNKFLKGYTKFYNKNGRVIEHTEMGDDKKVTLQYNYQYDHDDLLLSYTQLRQFNFKQFDMRYTFPEGGQYWLRREVYEDKMLKEVALRSIKPYQQKINAKK